MLLNRKSLIMKAVERYWANKIREIATWYPSLERLNSEIYKPKLYHPILDISRDLNPSKAAMTIGMRNMRQVIDLDLMQCKA
jgi:hypothetical protein